MVHISNINTLKSIYYAHFHSVIKYGIIIGSNSSNSGKIFTLEKQIVRRMAGAQPHVGVYLNKYKFYLFHAYIYFC